MTNEISVALYLFKRLRQLGVESVHGVPGDFNLVALDILPEADLKWVGNTNELNAAYAADGYARIKGLGALITTFGVGELSALAGVAGSFSERVPVVHIVGVPSTQSQKSGLLLHHTLGDGNFATFVNMSRNISQTVAILNDPMTAASEIDRALAICYTTARPVYIALPTDIVTKPIATTIFSTLETPIDLTLSPNEPEVEDDVIQTLSELIYKSNNAVILADACCVRHRVVEETRELIEKSQLPAFVTPMAKGAIDETNPRFGGVYVGSVSRPDVKQAVESADLLLNIGALKSDFNTGSFTYHTTARRTVEFHSDHMKIGHSVYPDIKMKYVLRRLLDTLDFSKIKSSKSATSEPPLLENKVPEGAESGTQFAADGGRQPKQGEVTHAWFWPRLGQWLKPKDVIVTETGTANFGILETRFPAGVIGISQVLWGSIGYSVGCLQGAALATRETDPSRRVILIVGDGSLQLTVTEISTLIRHGLTPIIFVINNEGYTIERLIHGENAGYNDIQPWKHTALLELFGAKEGEYKNYVVKNRDEVENLFGDEEFSKAGKIQLVELFMPKMDAPRSLNVTAELTAKRNAEG